MSNFEGLKYFKADSSTDQWGDPSKISRDLLLKLDQLRTSIGGPIVVTSGWRAHGSTDGSMHPFGKAVDVVAPGITLEKFYEAAKLVGFPGLGVYPNWRYQGNKIGGLHLDVREGKPGRWMGVPGSKPGTQTYIGLNEANLKKWRVIDDGT